MGEDFWFCECTAVACGLRFPSPAGHVTRRRCPRCGAATAVLVPAASFGKTAVLPTPVRPLAVLLDNIRSIHNVGSMFRTADGAGVTHLYLCGITSTPAQPKLAKAALGAEQTVSWSYHANGLETAVWLQQQGHPLWALEAAPVAQPLANFCPAPSSQPPVLIVGNEKAGVDPALLALCDQVLALPMYGHKASLNVAVAMGVAVYMLAGL